MFCGGAAELGVDFYLLSARKEGRREGGRGKAEQQQQPSVKENIADGTGSSAAIFIASRLLEPRIGSLGVNC